MLLRAGYCAVFRGALPFAAVVGLIFLLCVLCCLPCLVLLWATVCHVVFFGAVWCCGVLHHAVWRCAPDALPSGACPWVTLGRTRQRAGRQSAALSGHPHAAKRSRILATLQQNESMYINTPRYVHTDGLSH